MGEAMYGFIYRNKNLNTYEDLRDWYYTKLSEFTKADRNFDELPFVELERKQVIELLQDNVPDDNESELFKNALFRYLAQFLNARLFVAQQKQEPIKNHFKDHIKWFNSQSGLLKDDKLKQEFLTQEINRTRETSLTWLQPGVDLLDERTKAEFEGGQRYLEFLKAEERKINEPEEGEVIKINPTHNFEELKAHRHTLFEKRKEVFLKQQKENNVKTSKIDLDYCYLFWLQDEMKVADQWLSDTYPNGDKKIVKHRDQVKVELLKYKSFVKEGINKLTPSETEVMNKRQSSKNEKSPLKDFFEQIRYGEVTNLEIHNKVEEITNGFNPVKLQLLFNDFEDYLFVVKDDKQAEFPSDIVAKDVNRRIDANIPVPYLKFPEIKAKDGRLISEQSNNVVDIEQLFYPHEFWFCDAFLNMLKYRIEKSKEEDLLKNYTTTKENIEGNQIEETFNSLLQENKATFILKMLEDLSITLNGKYNLSQKKKSAIKGVVEALRDKHILPSKGIDYLNEIVAAKIQMELKSNLEKTYTSDEFKKSAIKYIERNYTF